tara:strand:+ start:249 stop:770 length:522 start_codon:yes stop_codon:yes gene_type:complete
MGLQWAEAQVEPKRQFRWTFQFPGDGAAELLPTWIVKAAGKPKFSVSESSHKYLNHTFYYPGRVEWEELQITLVDPVSPDASASLYGLLKASGYDTPREQAEGPMRTISKFGSNAVIGNGILSQYNQLGTLADVWTLNNMWIKSVDFGSLDYENDDLVNIELTIRYDWASLGG